MNAPIQQRSSGDRTVVRRVAAFMAFAAGTLAVASALHLSGSVHGSEPFDAQHAGIAEAIIGTVLASGAIVMFRAPGRARTVGLATIGFAIVGFLVGLNFTARGGHLPDVAYHVILLPAFGGSMIVLGGSERDEMAATVSDATPGRGRREVMATSTTGPERVALVAGASRGIGADTAKAFARAGHAVVLGARDADALAHVVEEIEASGGRAVAAKTDVGDVDSMRALVKLALDSFGRLDAAFNNATDGPMPGPLADIDPDEFDLGIRTNIRGTFLGMKFEIPAMLASGGGAIVNMGSVAAVRAMTNLAAYVTGKAGIIALTETAALDYADRGVRVNVVAPGPILTDHLLQAGPEAQRMAAASVPMGRVGTTAEVADAVLWLCSEQSTFITGATVPIDGGQLAGHKPPQMYRRGEGMVST
jgi:NAD(P)-dependent dehydrogenase (short-subunit alcohol dehydrogenase family)